MQIARLKEYRVKIGYGQHMCFLALPPPVPASCRFPRPLSPPSLKGKPKYFCDSTCSLPHGAGQKSDIPWLRRRNHTANVETNGQLDAK